MMLSMLLLVGAPLVLVAVGALLHLKETNTRNSPPGGKDQYQEKKP